MRSLAKTKVGHGEPAEARKELEEILGVKVFLELRVKVERDWRENSRIVQQLDWRRQLERLGSGE